MRGEWVHLDESWRAALAHVDYPAPVRAALGDALAAVGMFSASLKMAGSLTLQISGDGPLKLLVAQARGQRVLRGMAQWRDLGAVQPSGELLFGSNSQLAVTFDPGEQRERYQGVVEIARGSVGTALERYFTQSEQLPTRFWFANDSEQAVGLMLQVLPGVSDDADAWNRLTILADTVAPDELLRWDIGTLLRRVFAEDDIQLFEAEPIRFQCDCSRERVDTILRAMGEPEVGAILVEQGQVEVRCEFCNAVYRYDRVDAAALLTSAIQAPCARQKH